MIRWPRKPVGFSLGGRILALVLLLLAVWNPPIAWNTPPLNLILLLDDSLSTGREAADLAWREIVAQSMESPAGSHFSLLRFAAEPVLEISRFPIDSWRARNAPATPAPPRSQRLDPNRTDIEQALRAALALTKPDSAPRILLATDGRATSGDAGRVMALAQELSVPLFWWRPVQTGIAGDGWVHSLQGPGQAGLRGTVPMSALLKTATPGAGRVQVSLDRERILEQEVFLNPEEPALIDFHVTPGDAGPHLVEVKLDVPGDPVPQNDRRAHLIQVQGPARVLYVGEQGADSGLSRALVAGGWPLVGTTPEQLQAEVLVNSDVIILDDIAVGALPAGTWREIAEAVRSGGAGLIALGGTRSFGGGGYRHSVLEQLLPVTAESRRPPDPAALLFVLDKSGSMDFKAHPRGPSRMDTALRAIRQSAAFLEAEDLAGLITFDVEPRVRIPLTPYAVAARRFGQPMDFGPRGGTRLEPALAEAIDMLSSSGMDQRVLVLVTDGFLEEAQALSGIAGRIEVADIDLVALKIGAEPGADALQQLTRVNRGRLLPVKDIARLPRLMRDEVMKRRTAMESGPVIPREMERLPFLSGDYGNWPSLDGYMVTRARPEAEVYLVSQKGDPLVASLFAGSGRVIALPGGLDQWAGNWHKWNEWGRLLGGLVEWANGNRSNPFIDVSHRSQPGSVELKLDTVTDEMVWESGSPPLVRVRDPLDRTRSLKASLDAPGRYSLNIPVPVLGLYRFFIAQGDRSARYALYHQPDDEFSVRPETDLALEEAVRKGLLLPWSEEVLEARWAPEPQAVGFRRGFLTLALVIYMAVLVLERLWPHPGFPNKGKPGRNGYLPWNRRGNLRTRKLQ